MKTTAIDERTTGQDGVMDVREMPCSTKHGLVFKACMSLPVGGHLLLLNGHNPQTLLNQLDDGWPGTFTWEHLVNTPDECLVKITRLKINSGNMLMPSPPECSH